jgi:hypothetical protein
MRSLQGRLACRNAAGRFIGVDCGHGGELLQRVELQECLEHCLRAHTILNDERPRRERPGIITLEEKEWLFRVIEERPEWATAILRGHGFPDRAAS